MVSISPLDAINKVRIDINARLKNGFVLTVLEFDKMNGQMREIKRVTEELVLLINEEMKI